MTGDTNKHEGHKGSLHIDVHRVLRVRFDHKPFRIHILQRRRRTHNTILHLFDIPSKHVRRRRDRVDRLHEWAVCDERLSVIVDVAQIFKVKLCSGDVPKP